MDDCRIRSETLRRNEQIKARSNVATNIGTGLLAASAGRWFFESLDEHVIYWFVLGSMLIWGGIAHLALLEAED